MYKGIYDAVNTFHLYMNTNITGKICKPSAL